jgi:hypothetical protein
MLTYLASALVWLLAVAARVDLKLFRSYRSPLNQAKREGHRECLAVLVAAGAYDVDDTPDDSDDDVH